MRVRRAIGWALMGFALLGAAIGCERPPKPVAAPSRPFQGVKVVVGVVGNPAVLASIKSQRGEWAARTGGDLEIRETPIDPKATSGVDVVVFPGDRIGDLADIKALSPITNAEVEPAPVEAASDEAPKPPADPFAYQDIVPAYRDVVTRYGPDRLALPLGGSALAIAYHKKTLDDPAVREATEKAGVSLGPPKTWDDFDALARLLHGRGGSGVALAWGDDPEGVGDGVFLARAAASAFHRDQFAFLLDSETTEPRVTSPPFVEALKALVTLKDFGPPGAATFDAEAARKAFRSGGAALLIDRAERVGSWVEGDGTAVGVWPLPGSKRVFDPSRQAWEDVTSVNRPTYLLHGGGWLVGVVAASPRRAAAVDFARHLAGPDATDQLRAERSFPMLATRETQLTKGMSSPRSAPGVDSRAWADAVRRTIVNDRVAPGLRLPDALGYLADVAKARVAAVSGTSAEQALDALAKAWAERTRSLGRERQTWHHRRGLPGLVTPAEPPPR